MGNVLINNAGKWLIFLYGSGSEQHGQQLVCVCVWHCKAQLGGHDAV